MAAPSTPLSWTRKKPTANGFYFKCDPDRGGPSVLVEIIFDDGEMHHYAPDCWVGIETWRWWYGPLPIEVPDPPATSA